MKKTKSKRPVNKLKELLQFDAWFDDDHPNTLLMDAEGRLFLKNRWDNLEAKEADLAEALDWYITGRSLAAAKEAGYYGDMREVCQQAAAEIRRLRAIVAEGRPA